MSCPLFIHHDQKFLDRIQEEAAHSSLVRTSLVQGLRVISNPEIPLSGIYFNPADSSYSALRFIELALIHRPATPLFILSEDANQEDSRYQALLITNHIRASFTGAESYQELTRSLNLKPLEILSELKRESSKRVDYPGYTAIPIVDFIHERHYPFNVFIETDQHKLTLFSNAKNEVDPEYLVHAAGVTNWLYVADQEILNKRAQLKDTQLRFMELEQMPALWKTAEVLFHAKSVLHELQKSGLNDQLVEQTLFMLGDVFQMVSTLSMLPGNTNLNLFVQQAKECDRTIASATLSILMCKALKFDRNAVLEILGLASLLQDVSLYNSPFGNISKSQRSELTPEALAFYQQHPLISADLVAQNSSVPDVTLQVIRQHHEKKDRTGFPNRVGGMQLHPMAEVLSLINAFLDVTGNSSKIIDESLMVRLDQEVFPHYSERIVTAFKSILQSFLEQSHSRLVA